MTKKRRPDNWRPYRIRDANLATLGFETYANYLASDLWGGIRRRVFAKSKTCWVCGQASATQIHHGQYDLRTLRGLDLSHLHPVCGSCHHKIEFAGSQKRTPRKVGRVAKKLHKKAIRRAKKEQQRLATLRADAAVYYRAPPPIAEEFYLPRIWE